MSCLFPSFRPAPFLLSVNPFLSPLFSDVARHREHFEGIESITVQQTFMFGVVLLVNVWGGKKSGSIGDPDLALKDVGKILALEASAENRLLFAGKLQ